MAPAEEDHEDDLCGAEDLAANRAREDHARVGHVMYVRVAQFEGADHVACYGRDTAEADDEDAAGNHAEAVEHGRDGQDLQNLSDGDAGSD